MNLTPFIEEKGQPYYDEYAPPKKAEHVVVLNPRPIAAAMGKQPFVASFNRVGLNWIRAMNNGNDGLQQERGGYV